MRSPIFSFYKLCSVTDSLVNLLTFFLLVFKTSKIPNLRTSNFDTMATTPCVVSCDICHVSGVTCQGSGVMCHMSSVTCKMSHVSWTSKTVRALVLKFWENVYLLGPVICPVSRVACHMSHVKCIFYFYFFYKVVKLVRGRSVINGVFPF